VTRARRIGAAVAVAALAFVAVTWWALESGEVALLRTGGAGGAPHETRVWVADEGGFAWIEAATPEREWYARVTRDPLVELVRHGTAAAYVATPVLGPEGHALIRRLLRAKYGVRDVWVGLLQDTARSIAVRLAPAPPARAR
jgi:F420H(2)-dependent quinone reductase